MFASMNDTIRPGIEAELRSLSSRRASREPLAYITGRRGFYGRELSVTPDVLIPRQETELLVDLALRWVTSHPFKQSNVRIADIGTGSGALAVTLAAELGQSRVDAVDVSPSALNVAQQNALVHRVAATGGLAGACVGPTWWRRWHGPDQTVGNNVTGHYGSPWLFCSL